MCAIWYVHCLQMTQSHPADAVSTETNWVAQRERAALAHLLGTSHPGRPSLPNNAPAKAMEQVNEATESATLGEFECNICFEVRVLSSRDSLVRVWVCVLGRVCIAGVLCCYCLVVGMHGCGLPRVACDQLV